MTAICYHAYGDPNCCCPQPEPDVCADCGCEEDDCTCEDFDPVVAEDDGGTGHEPGDDYRTTRMADDA